MLEPLPISTYAMLQNFVPDPAPQPPADTAQAQLAAPSTPVPQAAPDEPNRDPVRILVIGTPPGINAICHSLHVKGFARLDEWSPLLPHDAGRYCRILTRQVLLP
jgi:hypothetical protein